MIVACLRTPVALTAKAGGASVGSDAPDCAGAERRFTWLKGEPGAPCSSGLDCRPTCCACVIGPVPNALTSWCIGGKCASAKHNDIELQDWIMGIVLPCVCYLLVGATGVGFITGAAASFNGLALATISVLMLGIFAAWELILWLALTRAAAANAERPSK